MPRSMDALSLVSKIRGILDAMRAHMSSTQLFTAKLIICLVLGLRAFLFILLVIYVS